MGWLEVAETGDDRIGITDASPTGKRYRRWKFRANVSVGLGYLILFVASVTTWLPKLITPIVFVLIGLPLLFGIILDIKIRRRLRATGGQPGAADDGRPLG